jgi:hypothetical protein
MSSIFIDGAVCFPKPDRFYFWMLKTVAPSGVEIT